MSHCDDLCDRKDCRRPRGWGGHEGHHTFVEPPAPESQPGGELHPGPEDIEAAQAEAHAFVLSCSWACPLIPNGVHCAVCYRLTNSLVAFRMRALAAGRAWGIGEERKRCLRWVDQVKLGDFAKDWQDACDAVRLPIVVGKESK